MKFRNAVTRFRRNERGAIVVMVALMMPILVGFIGLGVEVGLWFQQKRDLQTIADAAAIAGAYEAMESDASSTTITAEATNDATRNGYSASTNTIAVTNPPSAGSYTTDTGAVEVNMTSTVALLFVGNLMSSSSISIAARAVATAVSSGEEACVLALGTSESRAVSLSGGASVTMDGCQVASNSSESDAVYVSNNSSLTVDCVSTVGQVDGTEDITLSTCASVNENTTTINDPYSDLTVPDDAKVCDYNSNVTVGSDRDFTAADDDLNGDGYVVFCGNLSINAGTTVTFEDDMVVSMYGSDLTINGGANVTGDSLTVISTGSGTNQNGWGSMTINGGGTVTMTAPTSGDWAGILFFQDGDAVSNANLDFSFSGNSDTEFTGVIYVPNNDVSFTGGNDTDDNGCLQIVADEVSFGGSADLENDCDGTGVEPIYVSNTVSLVE